jgi:thiamine-monophosphate kinase
VTELPFGEFELIDRIIARLGDSAATEILVPPGDDAAAWATGEGVTVASIDAAVEDSHWYAGRPLGDAGWRAVAGAISDIAAMGAELEQLLVATVIGADVTVEALDALIDGMADACRCHGARIAGGDIVRGVQTALTVTVIGHSPHADRLLRRDAARPGDAVAVSGTPGASAGGFALLGTEREDDAAVASLLTAHRRPVARIALGRGAVDAGVRCAIDISDGLLQDVGHIAERSGAGIEIDLAALPLHPAAVETFGERQARDMALGGGEDYELALAGPADALATLATGDVPVTMVGRVVAEHPGEAWAIAEDGTRYEPPTAGWDQLRSGDSSDAR